ncbi:MAG: NADH-ubiquinone oxidoreductase-F iron-sulfur binding region domain-containing protein [Brevinema sp.]
MSTRRLTVPYDVTQSTGTILDILLQYSNICAVEFCGKCMPCRYGTKEWSFIVQKLIEGHGTLKDLKRLQEINHSMKTASFCRLGLISPFVIDAILKYHHQELYDYIQEGTPLPTNISELPKFIIHPDLCDGCPTEEKAFCQKVCTVNAIEGEQGIPHLINQLKCFRCDDCVPVCPKAAIAFV